jgi:hypothetical protein
MVACRSTPEEWIARAREHWDLPEDGEIIVIPNVERVCGLGEESGGNS